MASSLFKNQPTTENLMNKINPQQMQMISQLLNNKGMTAEQMVRNICKERGINVDMFLSQLKK